MYQLGIKRPEKYPGEFAHLAQQLQSQQEMGLIMKKKKKKKTAKEDGSESEGDDLDLSVEMHPLSHYVTDHEELVSQMFASIRGSKLDGMMPPVLKSIPLHELKKLCLHELRGMSKKRILCVISGQDMEGSSESELEEEERDDISSDEEEKKEKTTPLSKKVSSNSKSDQPPSNNQAFPEYLMKTIKVEPPDDGPPGEKRSAGGKSVLELLELQMRARIIKTMLEKGDDGKALTEGAIAALIATPAQAGQISDAVKLDPKIAKALVRSEAPQGEDETNIDNEKISKERSGRSKRNSEGEKHREGEERQSRTRKGHHRSSSGSKKGSKRQRSNDSRKEDGEKKSRRERGSDKSSKMKKKITRQEFEERMKRAKKNRTYRQRKSSEDEEKAALKAKCKDEAAPEEKSKEGAEDEGDKHDDGETLGEREEGEVGPGKERELASEKEEGECDSDEDEEGACSPSDISSASYYSSSRSYSSRSRSRSYSRSKSRSPSRRRGSGYGRGKSRSWTRSRSRSRSNDRNRRDVGRWPKNKTSKDRGAPGSKRMRGGIVSMPGATQKPQKEEEENWGQKCDIEFVDSEEDFDDATTDGSKNVPADSSKKPLPMKGQNSERANISFSLQKKTTPSITPNVDLDDLPLKLPSLNRNKEDLHMKRFGEKEPIPNAEEIINLDSPKPVLNEILISSDSDNEVSDTGKAKSVRVEKRDSVPSAKETAGSFKKKKTAPAKMVKDVVFEKNTNAAQNVSKGVDFKLYSEASNKSSTEKVKHFDKSDINVESAIIQNAPLNNESEQVQAECSKENEEVTEQKGNDKITDLEGLKCVDNDDMVGKDSESVVSSKSNSGSRVGVELAENIDGSGSVSRSTKDAEQLKETLKDDESKLVITSSTEKGQIASNTMDIILGEKKEKEDTSNPAGMETDNMVEDLNSMPSNTKLPRVSRRKKNPPCKVDMSQMPQRRSARNQKIQLEHLQESYDEEQGNQAEEPAKPHQEVVLPVEVSVQKTLTDSSKNDMPSENESALKSSQEIVEESKEMHSVGKQEESNILNVKKYEGNFEGGNKSIIEEEEENRTINPNEEQLEDSTKHHDESTKEKSKDDFYRGADQLNFSDEELDHDNKHEEFIREDRHVEPIRIEMGLIRRRVLHSKKTEMAAPDKSWTKREKKKDKPIEGIGLLKTALAESVQSPAFKEDEEYHSRMQDSSEGKETFDQGNDDDTCASWGVSSISSKDDTSLDLRIQSPKDAEVKERETSSVSGDNENCDLDEEDTAPKKCEQETEIIGVIETNDADQMEGIDLGGSSWSMRWLQSEKVQKVVSSSKMLSRVRKKFQKKDKATKVVPTVKPEVIHRKLPVPVVPIIGSIEEYERLFGMKAKQPSDNADAVAATSEITSAASGVEAVQPGVTKEDENTPKKPTTFGSDDEGEDSEEEALWSKILGK